MTVTNPMKANNTPDNPTVGRFISLPNVASTAHIIIAGIMYLVTFPFIIVSIFASAYSLILYMANRFMIRCNMFVWHIRYDILVYTGEDDENPNNSAICPFVAIFATVMANNIMYIIIFILKIYFVFFFCGSNILFAGLQTVGLCRI